MSEQVLLQLAGVLILGIALQWVAWRLHFPAILLLLGAGLVLGPGTALLARHGIMRETLLEPGKLFGNLLLPAVSLAVALILFEGGLTLNLREHKSAGAIIWLLVTLGATITCCISTVAAHFLLGLNWPLAVLLGAILVVTGPTVIGPLLRQVRPGGRVAAILKWEGIIIDPVGAMVAIVVFEALASGQLAWAPILRSAASTIAAGAACGLLGTGLIMMFFRRHWVPDFLHSGFVLAVALLAFAGGNFIRHESGLFAASLMGLLLANQRRINIHHVIEFKESLSILLISALFIVLGAHLTLEQLALVPWLDMFFFLIVLIFIARPLSVIVSTAFSSLTWPERQFIACLAPRGIVAAAVASVFALRLDTERFEQVELLVPITFATIIGTVTFYGLTASHLARKLGLSKPANQGFLIAGAGTVERTLAAALMDAGRHVLVVDTNHANIAKARAQGLPVLHGSVLSRFAAEETQLTSIGRFLALTSNDEVNALATMQFQRTFSRSEVYQLAPAPRSNVRHEKITQELRGRLLFSPEMTYDALENKIDAGAAIKKTPITAVYTYQDFKKNASPDTLPLFLCTAQGELSLFTSEFPPKAHPGDTLFSLAPPKPAAQPGSQSTPDVIGMDQSAPQAHASSSPAPAAQPHSPQLPPQNPSPIPLP